MRYHLKSCSQDIVDISLKLSCMSIINIEWSCLYSGAGILHILTEKDSKKLLEHMSEKHSQEILQNLAMIKCLYKKAKPAFTKPPEDIINPGKYMWDFKSFHKLILPSAQAMAMLSLCRAAEILYETDKSLGTAMVQSAKVLYDFTSTYMRNEEGLFVNVEDKTKYINEEPKLKQSQNEEKLIDQLLIHEAFLSLYYITSNKSLKGYYTSRCTKYLDEARNIYTFIKENPNLLLNQSSKEISACISSLSRCCCINKDIETVASYRELIATLCAEIDSRIKITGEVEKSFKNLMPASLMTHFKTASALLEGYLVTGIYKFKELADRILTYIDDLYDPLSGMFLKNNEKKLGYSIRDISDIIKTLFLRHMTGEDEKFSEMLIEFYECTIEKTNIMQSSPCRKMNILKKEVVLPELLPNTLDIGRAPVFMKSFKIIPKKDPSCIASKNFNSLYALYASYTFLHYLVPYERQDNKDELKPPKNNELLEENKSENTNGNQVESPELINDPKQADTAIETPFISYSEPPINI